MTPTVPIPTFPPEPVAPVSPWNLTYSNNQSSYCIMLSLAARVDIIYLNELNNTVETALDIPDNATVNKQRSKCVPGQSQQVFSLQFEPSAASKADLVITFKQISSNYSTVYEIEFFIEVTKDIFPGILPKYIGNYLSLIYNLSYAV